jgi:2-hydroxychromene-2-carboxylate isomerase
VAAIEVVTSRPGDRPVFYYDFVSPEAYLACERVVDALGAVPVFEPVLLSALPGSGELDAFRCAEEREIYRASVERRAAERGLQPVRWPADWPGDTEAAMRVASWARQIGKVVAFSLAAFRQAFAGGRDLADVDTVLIAAAACEMHPNAVLKALERASVAEELRASTRAAASHGVRSVPAIRVGNTVFDGESGLEAAAVELRRA